MTRTQRPSAHAPPISVTSRVSSSAMRKSLRANVTESDRAELAHDLVASLDGAADADAIDQWDAELLQRFAEVEAGTATLLNR